jgi:hypothetical protein
LVVAAVPAHIASVHCDRVHDRDIVDCPEGIAMSRARDIAIHERIEEWTAVEVAELIDIGSVVEWPLEPNTRLQWHDVCHQLMINRSGRARTGSAHGPEE